MGVRPRRALRQAHRQAEAGRLSHGPADRRDPTGPEHLGWDPGLGRDLRAVRGAGATARPGRRRPRETSIVARRRRSTAPAIVSGRFRFEALAPSDFPTVGDWVALEPETGAAGPEPRGPGVIAAVLPRRSAFRRSAADSNRRTAGLLADEQVMASNVDVALLVAGLDDDFNLRRLERYLAVAWSSGVTPVVVLNKADLADDVDGRRVAVEAIAPGVPIVTLSALTGDHLADLRPHLRPGPDRRRPRLVGRRQVHARQRAARRGAPGRRRGPRRTTRAAATRRRTASCSGCPAGALLVDTPGIRSLEVAGADEGVDAAFDDIAEHRRRLPLQRLPARRRAGLRGPGGARRRDRLTEDRLASHRKLERELAHAQRKEDPRARAAHKREWRLIHKSVNEHMKRKYGADR